MLLCRLRLQPESASRNFSSCGPQDRAWSAPLNCVTGMARGLLEPRPPPDVTRAASLRGDQLTTCCLLHRCSGVLRLATTSGEHHIKLLSVTYAGSRHDNRQRYATSVHQKMALAALSSPDPSDCIPLPHQQRFHRCVVNASGRARHPAPRFKMKPFQQHSGIFPFRFVDPPSKYAGKDGVLMNRAAIGETGKQAHREQKNSRRKPSTGIAAQAAMRSGERNASSTGHQRASGRHSGA